MKKRYFAFIPAISCMGLSSISAETKLESSLEKVASKVDTDGTYLQLNKFDGDIETLVEYGELALDLAKKEETSIPADLKVEKIVKLIGLDQMKALAASSKKVDGSWNNLSYIYTGGSNKGLLSVYGDTDEKVSVADFAPETTDIAFQLRVNLSQGKAIITEIAELVGAKEEMEENMNEKQDDIGGLTPFELIEKLNFRASLAIDLDRSSRIPLPGGFDAPTPELVARIDDATWAWELFGEDLLKQTNLPWETKVEDGVTTCTLPANVTESMMGYDPIILVDKKHVWVATKKTILDAAKGDGKKLKDGAAYKKTMASLPKFSNSSAYFSKDLMDELVSQYNKAEENGLLADEDFQTAKPLVDKLIKDLTSSESGIAALVAKDKDGIYSALRVPFPLKNYLNQLTPMLQSLVFAGQQRKMALDGFGGGRPKRVQ